MDVKVLGEGYSPEDEEDMVKATVEDIWISEARFDLVAFPGEMSSADVPFTLSGISYPQLRFPLAILSC
jgi:hypothetical protein